MKNTVSYLALVALGVHPSLLLHDRRNAHQVVLDDSVFNAAQALVGNVGLLPLVGYDLCFDDLAVAA